MPGFVCPGQFAAIKTEGFPDPFARWLHPLQKEAATPLGGGVGLLAPLPLRLQRVRSSIFLTTKGIIRFRRLTPRELLLASLA